VDYHVEQNALVVQGNSFMAHYGDDLSITTEFQGLKNIFSGESFFWIKTQGHGHLIFNAFGVIYTVDVDGEYIIDTGHVVAFEDTLKYHLSKVGNSWLSSFLGGEGFVLRFEGKGRVWCQSHNPNNFGTTIGPMLRSR
ncbi:MAG: TIGR00266 family protein, partial [Rickettsiales bacterium]|nr:TIGR00266 family protein [Rickettsiales bacterium]